MSPVLNFVIILMTLAAGLVTFPAQASLPSTPQQIPDLDNKTLTEMLGPKGYNSGYNHGCSDAHQGGHPFLYGSGGASNHTTVFMQGYNDGWRNCTTSWETRSP